MQPQIIFQDNDIVVLNKPSGMTVNRADTTRHEVTVQDWVEKYIQLTFNDTSVYNATYEFEDPSITFKNRAGIVHRLDKETSGILLTAKNVASFVHLQKQFKDRVVKKTYQALAHGKLIPEVGEIRAPVGRQEWNRKRFGVIAGGREAVTSYKTLSTYQLKTKSREVLTLLELYPLTGRTHQIRVHLKYLNHPIFSDELYAGRKTAREDRRYLGRLFLHAFHIEFIHPTTDKAISFSSNMTSDLQTFLLTYCDKII